QQQQLKQQYPYIRVCQASAPTFAKILSIFACIVEDTISSIPQTSKINFPPIPGSPQQIKKCFVSSTNDSKNGKDSNNIDNTNSMTSSKDSSTTSNIDKDRKVNRTQLAIVSSSSVETKSSNISSQVPLNNSLTNIHTITIRQSMIYLFSSRYHFPTHIINQLEMIEETVAGYDVSSHFIYHISEFLVMLAHDILHSKQFIKALQWLTIIVDSVRNEDDKWKRFSRQIVNVFLIHLQSHVTIGSITFGYIFYTINTIWCCIICELRPTDPFVVAFRVLANGNIRGYQLALLRILHDVLLRILTNTRQLRGQIDITLVSLASDYIYLLIDTYTYVHNLFSLIHRTSVASYLFVESIYTNWDNLLKRNKLLLSLKIFRTLEGIHLDETGLLLVLLIEQFLPLPYISVLRLAELIVLIVLKRC
ncbi:unnamed protein product, partial [Rotaria sp. Silwood1]